MSRPLTMNPAFLPPQTNGVLKALLEKPLKLCLQDEGDQSFHFVTLQHMKNNNFIDLTFRSPAVISRINSYWFCCFEDLFYSFSRVVRR